MTNGVGRENIRCNYSDLVSRDHRVKRHCPHGRVRRSRTRTADPGISADVRGPVRRGDSSAMLKTLASQTPAGAQCAESSCDLTATHWGQTIYRTALRFASSLLAAVVIGVALPAQLFAQHGGSPHDRVGTDSAYITGKVFVDGSVPVVGARVVLTPLGDSTHTDAAGRFEFGPVPSGHYRIVASLRAIRGDAPPASDHRARWGAEREVDVLAGHVTHVTIMLAGPIATLLPIAVTATRPLHVIGHLPDTRDGVIYSGKKTEVIVMDSLQANLAQDVERQILGRIPGANFSETEGAGFPSNGVGFRGLNPTQSVEMNVRQNGIGIAADLFGYPEAYFTPPAEALQRIEVVRGAGSLAFGPQFGGAINYVVRSGDPDTKPEVTVGQTDGSHGFVNTFSSVGGGRGPWTYYSYFNYRADGGWRPNSDYRQETGYASVGYRVSDRLNLGVEFTEFRNRIHMPGGLSDAEFAVGADQSFRSRNWLASPWNVIAAHSDYRFGTRAHLWTTASYMTSERFLVWRNEDGGPAAPDVINPLTGTYGPRDVERETFQHGTLESRLTVQHALGGKPATLAAGISGFGGTLGRFEGGPGSTGSGFDMQLYRGTWEKALHFSTANIAAFAEDLVRITDRLSVTPGVRYEYLRSTALGYTDGSSTFAPLTASVALVGIGATYTTSLSTEAYANFSDAYRPVLYESLTPFGSVARVDPALHPSRGYNADLGWRGTLGHVLKLDVDGFYVWYGDRIGTRTVSDSGNSGSAIEETANIGTSVHRGVEAYFEFDPLRMAGVPRAVGALDLFTSFAYVDARYVSGAFKGNDVEQAPRTLTRVGVTYALGPVASTLQVSHTARSFGDANNSVDPNDNPAAGLVPAYTLLDWSGSARLGRRYELTFGVNNLANTAYFTKRTDEYPGPGILPGIGRSVYAGLRIVPQ
ncbi:MAG: TonB-dependent receptor domain-containing protein [Gemmatimonadaceae bacterium]